MKQIVDYNKLELSNNKQILNSILYHKTILSGNTNNFRSDS